MRSADATDAATNEAEEAGDCVLYVNVYRVSRHYGGPEEGGWHYDIGEPVESHFNHEGTPESAEVRRKELEKIYAEHQPKRSRFSVIGGADYVVTVEGHFARGYPEEGPTYE